MHHSLFSQTGFVLTWYTIFVAPIIDIVAGDQGVLFGPAALLCDGLEALPDLLAVVPAIGAEIGVEPLHGRFVVGLRVVRGELGRRFGRRERRLYRPLLLLRAPRVDCPAPL